MEKFSINEKCIGCKACERVAESNFIVEDKLAKVFKQPDNEEELNNCRSAFEVCPTDAIDIEQNEVITSISKVRSTLEKYPQLKEKLVELSPKFKTMQKPAMWNTVARFATFKDAARMSGVSVCEILHVINKELGVEEELINNFPECIQEKKDDFKDNSVMITWHEPMQITNISRVENERTSEVIDKIKELGEGESIVIESSFVIIPLIKAIEDMGFVYNLLKFNPGKFRLSVFNNRGGDWRERKLSFEKLDVRGMTSDPFDIIIKKAYSLDEDDGFILVQTFTPDPMLNMLSEMGFEYEVEEKNMAETWVYLHKKITEKVAGETPKSELPQITIQSATPVGYPIIMRLLQSDKLKKVVGIKELKVWEETEKHLGWIVNGKADVSFSAVITASKLKNSDVKMPAVFVWDNFSILTRGYKAESFSDLKGKDISVPLFEDAPPAKITRYLIEAEGNDISDYNFVYGNPFGRPEQIMADFISGKADTVLLREPEASFAMKSMENKRIDYSVLSYGDIWNKANEGFGIFPNAGVVFKGELVRNYPDIVKLFMEELKDSIEWVNKHKIEAAKLSFDMMRQPQPSVEMFLNNVTFKYVTGDELTDKIEKFYKILIKEGILQTEWDDQLKSVFRI